MSDDTETRLTVRQRAELDILPAQGGWYGQHLEVGVNMLEVERIRAAPLLAIAQAQAAPALEAAKASRDVGLAEAQAKAAIGAEEQRTKRLDLATKLIATAGVVAYANITTDPRMAVAVGIAVMLVMGGADTLSRGVGKILEAAADRLKPKKP